MRVGVIGPQYPDSFADNIVSALDQMGHEAVVLGPAYPVSRWPVVSHGLDVVRRVPTFDARLQAGVVRRAAEAQLDLVLCAQAVLLPSSVDGLRKQGAPVVLWFPDAISNLGRQLMFAGAYDALFFKEPVLVERARSVLDAPAHYLPEACNPAWHTPPTGTEVDPVVVVVGNLYPFRIRLIERLHRAGVPLRIYGGAGPKWASSPIVESLHTGRYIAREEKARVFRSAGAVLNGLSPSELEGVNCRLFEAAGCGAAVLSEERLELAKFFVPDEEVVAFRGFDDLVDRARWLLDNPDESRRIGDAAATRAHADHTYQHRLDHLLEVVGC